VLAAIARKHGRWAIGVEAKVMAEAIATEIEQAAPGFIGRPGPGGDVGPQPPERDQLTTIQPRGEDDEQTT